MDVLLASFISSLFPRYLVENALIQILTTTLIPIAQKGPPPPPKPFLFPPEHPKQNAFYFRYKTEGNVVRVICKGALWDHLPNKETVC